MIFQVPVIQRILLMQRIERIDGMSTRPPRAPKEVPLGGAPKEVPAGGALPTLPAVACVGDY